MPHLRELNNANTAKIMAETFGRYNIFASLSLSLRRSPYKRDSITFYFTRGSPASIYDFSCIHTREVGLFFVPVEQLRRVTNIRKQTFIINK